MPGKLKIKKAEAEISSVILIFFSSIEDSVLQLKGLVREQYRKPYPMAICVDLVVQHGLNQHCHNLGLNLRSGSIFVLL